MSLRLLERACGRPGGSRNGSLAGSLSRSLLRSLCGSLPDPHEPARIAGGHGRCAQVSGVEISITINPSRPGGRRGQ
jgi:hypothetical protein